MTSIHREVLTQLLQPQTAPCLSLYQTNHPGFPEKRQDPIQFRNLVKTMEDSLLQTYSAVETRGFLEPFQDLVKDPGFWNSTLPGLAVLAGPDQFHVFHLARPVPAFAGVADSFHVKPLWQFVQSTDRFHVLGLSLGGIRLFEGDRDVLYEVELAPEVPRTMAEALGAELTEPHQTVAAYGGVGGQSTSMHHGHGGKSPEMDVDTRKFFRVVAQAVLEHHSRPSGLPMILAALPEHHHDFRSVSDDPLLLSVGVNVDPNGVSREALHALAWPIVEPHLEARFMGLTDDFAQASAGDRASDDLQEIVKAAASGRVSTLLLAADRRIGGQINEQTGKVVDARLDNPRVDDVLDDLGELVWKMGGDVWVVNAAQMPTKEGAAAIYRY